MKMWECLTLGSSGQFLSLNCIQGIQGWRQEDRWEWKEVKEDVWRGGGCVKRRRRRRRAAVWSLAVSSCKNAPSEPDDTYRQNNLCVRHKTVKWILPGVNMVWLCVQERERGGEGGWSDHYSNSCVDQTHSRSCDIWIQSIWWSWKLSSSTSLIRIMQKNPLVTMITCLSACECMDFPW